MDLTEENLEQVEQEFRQDLTTAVATQDYTVPKVLYDQLIERIRRYHPSADISLVEKAYQVAYEYHKDQKRKSGEPYIIHPLSVALILADLEMDKETLAAGLLHDVLEDTPMTEAEMEAMFGKEVVLLVDGVTKLQNLPFMNESSAPMDKNTERMEMQAENLRKMFLAMAKDIRVIIIKLADRLHNMRTLKYQTEESKIRNARETQDIYCPLAQRLGISKIKCELEDLSMKYLYPEAYYDLVRTVASTKNDRNRYINGLADDVRRLVEEAGIQAEVYGRAKHFFSIYKKMVNQKKSIDEIYDLFAIRIIVEDIKDCYAALGLMHYNYKPIPGRFKDYIAMPKQNMYQSLHTTLIGPSGEPFEIQIRTREMHRTAEYGIAAHWKYKEANNGNATHTTVSEEEKLSWLRQILEWQQDASDNQEFLDVLKSDLDLFTDTVFAFTPTGDVKNLPMGSNPIDFAYAIHSQVGNRMIGAKVNNKMVPIDYVIKNGDIIEILTSPTSRGPSRDWLKLVKSTQAKNKINQYFRANQKEENIQRGKEMLAAYAKAKGYNFSDFNKPEYWERICRKYGFHDWNNCLATIGHGSLKESQIVHRMYDEWRKDHPVVQTDADIVKELEEKKEKQERQEKQEKQTRSRSKSGSGIVVKGLYDAAVHFSKCCNPVPGDSIIGFVTRGRGVSIHRSDCINITNMALEDKVRLIDAQWGPNANDIGEYQAEIKIYSIDRPGLLVDVARVFSEAGLNIGSVNIKTNKQGIATMQLAFSSKGRSQLFAIIGKLRQIESIIDIERSMG